MRVKTLESRRPVEHRAASVLTVAALAGLGVAVMPAGARAANVNWNVGDGNWDVAANWSPAMVPGAADLAFVGNATDGSTAHVTTDVVDPFGVFVFNGNVVSVETGGNLNVANNSTSPLDGLRIGDGFGLTTPAAGTGSAVVTGNGQLSTSSTGAGLETAHDLRVGADGGIGTLTINSADALVSAGRDLKIGEDNTVAPVDGGRTGSVGTINQSAGEVRLGGWGFVGMKGTGNYNLSGTGRLIVGDDNVANNPATGRRADRNFSVGVDGGTGTMTQTGGVAHVSSWTFVGRNGGTGTYNQSAGEHSTSGWVRIAEGGAAGPATGTYNLSGNAVLNIGNVTGGIGDNDLGDDLLAVGLGGGSTGTVTVADNAVVNVGFRIEAAVDGGSAVINQSGGTVTVAGAVADPNDVESSIGFNNTGTGTYNISGGTFNTGARLILGKFDTATGIVNQSGGLVDAGPGGVILGNSAGNTGTYNLNGGVLQTNVVDGGDGTANLNLNGGTLRADGPVADWITDVDTIRVQAGGAKFDTNGSNATINAVLPHDPALMTADGGLTKLGAGTLTLTAANTYNGGTNVQAGTLQVRRMHENNPVNITGGKLQVMDSSPTLPAHPSGDNAFVSRPSALAIANNGAPLGTRTYAGQLDLGNNDLILDYDGASPLDDIQDMIRAGYNGGDWLGNGITSSTANANRNFAIGVADNANLAIPFDATRPFSGQTVDTTTILVKFTHRIDLDMDGVITTNDATIFNSRYSEGAPAYWSIGDLDYDRVFTTNDATLFNSFYNEALASVPEPATLGVIGAAGALALLRRRQRPH